MTTLHHHTEPNTLVLTLDGTVHPAEVPAVRAAAARLMVAVRAGVVVDLSLAGDQGLATVDVLAHLCLMARRLGREFRIRHSSPTLRQLLDLSGLAEALQAGDECGCRACWTEPDHPGSPAV